MQSLSRVHAKVLPCAAHQHAGHELQHLLAVPFLEVRDEQLGHDAAVHVAAALTTEGLQGRKGAGHTSVHHTTHFQSPPPPCPPSHPHLHQGLVQCTAQHAALLGRAVLRRPAVICLGSSGGSRGLVLQPGSLHTLHTEGGRYMQ